MKSICACATRHTGEIRLLVKVSRLGARTLARSLTSPVCLAVHVCMARWSQDLAEQSWVDLRRDRFPGHMQQDTSVKAQPLHVTG